MFNPISAICNKKPNKRRGSKLRRKIVEHEDFNPCSSTTPRSSSSIRGYAPFNWARKKARAWLLVRQSILWRLDWWRVPENDQCWENDLFWADICVLLRNCCVYRLPYPTEVIVQYDSGLCTGVADYKSMTEQDVSFPALLLAGRTCCCDSACAWVQYAIRKPITWNAPSHNDRRNWLPCNKVFLKKTSCNCKTYWYIHSIPIPTLQRRTPWLILRQCSPL